jgi:hypothetical protein
MSVEHVEFLVEVVVNRLAIEELEAWYFGDWEAVRAAYQSSAGRTGQGEVPSA